MRRLILGAALLALSAPALAQDYSQYRNDGYSSYGDSRDRYDDRDGDRREVYRDRDGDGDYDRRDQYLNQQRGEYRGNDRYDRGRSDYRGSGYAFRAGRILPRQYNGSWIGNPWKYNLPAAPRGAHWMIIRHDAILIRNNDRLILRVVPRVI